MKVPPDHAGSRLDRFLAESGLGVTRSRARKLIDAGHVTVNGAVAASASLRLKEGAEVSVAMPEPEDMDTAAPEDIPLDVAYEDDEVIVINKPPGMVTHPSAGHRSGTLVNALLAHCGALSCVGGVTRPGIVHRLDKDTSGIIIAAKTDRAHQSLSAQLKDRTLSRTYVAVVRGKPKSTEGIIETSIGRHPVHRKKMAVLKKGGRVAVSSYRVAQELEGASVVEVSLRTGRTHQVRVHMKHIGCPIAGDTVYGRGGGGFPIKRQALHAWRLAFTHPATGRRMELAAPLADDMAGLIRALGGDPSPYSG